MYNLRLCSVGVSIVVMKSNNVLCVCGWVTYHCQQYDSINCYIEVLLLWRTHSAGNN